MLDGFQRYDVQTEDATIVSFIGGSGPPLLLLHGYPQTHIAWRHIAPVLARDYAVVATDLRGYGDGRGPQQADASAYSKRTMARDQLAVMKQFGFDRFAVIGHDRGARVGYRMALDHPEVVRAYVSLTVIPTSEMWARAGKDFALGAYHWLLFAQPYDLPERLLSGDPDFFLDWTLQRMARDAGAVSDDARAAYREAFRRPEVRHAMMQDYRAGATIDHEHDLADRAAGRVLDCPVLVLWEEGRLSDTNTTLQIWKNWASDVDGWAIPGGHLQPEEQSEAVLDAVRPFLARKRLG
ncbi:alpha/beta fold hydrolase [Bradyrhizobium arachidis]|uniref:Alpha/beta hydrolase n=1 Tax=Bradyrhizobium arachidis TaxID=858423 RepID=A0AAE7NPT1_9BRAD|nr:alpha/beta hydrolase [Bradyrhizobium arachidis]QOZ67305.1 alpha/beta hydrolase [Bradyrhizobium arachidis]SFU79677.1 haloacetate dehalogenase [Bradyrhizobium arachidis]